MTKVERLEIVEAHVKKHGKYVPQVFVEAARVPDHPAHGWFTWDDSVAAEKYRLWQAREFVSGLRIELEAPVVIVGGPVKLMTVPAFVSDETGNYVSMRVPEGMTRLNKV